MLKISSLLKILFFVSPFPLFFDLSTAEFLVERIPLGDLDALWSVKPSIPIPLVFLVIVLIYSLAVLSLFRRMNTIKILSVKSITVVNFYVFLFLPVFYLLNVNILVFVQVSMGLIFLAYLPVLQSEKVLIGCVRAYFFGILVWLALHLISIFFNNDFSFINVDRNFIFATFFGYVIYQALVSYAATMTLFSVVSLWAWREEVVEKHIAITVFTLAILMGFLSASRLFFIDFILIILALLIIFFRENTLSRVSKRLCLVAPVLLIVIFVGLSHYSNRVFSMGGGDRAELMMRAIREIFSNPELFFWGAGQAHSYAHNFFLDYALNFGVANLLILVALYLVIIVNMLRRIESSFNKMVFMTLLVLVVLTNSTFNSAISQPLFLSHVLIILLFIISIPCRLRRCNDPRVSAHLMTLTPSVH